MIYLTVHTIGEIFRQFFFRLLKKAGVPKQLRDVVLRDAWINPL